MTDEECFDIRKINVTEMSEGELRAYCDKHGIEHSGMNRLHIIKHLLSFL